MVLACNAIGMSQHPGENPPNSIFQPIRPRIIGAAPFDKVAPLTQQLRIVAFSPSVQHCVGKTWAVATVKPLSPGRRNSSLLEAIIYILKSCAASELRC